MNPVCGGGGRQSSTRPARLRTSTKPGYDPILTSTNDREGDDEGALSTAVGGRAPVMGPLRGAAPGRRPPLFYSPYEAAVWAVMSARRPLRQMAEVRRRLSVEHGKVFQLAGEPLAALPTPE